MPVIEHNPHERRPTNTIWWAALVVLAFQWFGMFYFGWIDWLSVSIGFGTGGILVAWASEKFERAPKSKRAEELLNSRHSRRV